jgi:hypothetical protein
MLGNYLGRITPDNGGALELHGLSAGSIIRKRAGDHFQSYSTLARLFPKISQGSVEHVGTTMPLKDGLVWFYDQLTVAKMDRPAGRRHARHGLGSRRLGSLFG